MSAWDNSGVGGLPPKQAPPWFASQEQYEAFLKLVAMDLGAQCITATSIDVEHLDEARRKEILGGYALLPSLQLVCSTYAALDAEALYSREAAFEKRFSDGLSADLGDKVKQALRKGSRLMPPPALNQLIREVIEWCTDADPSDGLDALGTADLVHLVLSINGDQEAQDRPDFFTSWPPSEEELAKYNEAMAVDDNLVLQELRRQMLSEFARMQTTATTVPQLVLGDTYDTWFKRWPESAPHDLIGDTPEEAFLNATKAPLREVIRMGLLLWDCTKAGDVAVSASSLESSLDPAALGLLQSSAALPIKEYRKRLAKERAKGFLAHRRYTFTERPLIEIAADEYMVLRPAWVLDRFCGSQLYWQTFFDFGMEKTLPGQQFSLAMNYVFEASVGYLLRRAMRRGRPAITLITEAQMQQAWTKGGYTPSVCDWVLVCGKTCLLVEATNHWLDEKAAQGFSDPEDYQADLEDTFVNKKFEQLRSTVKLLVEHGWEGCTFDEETVYVPLVVVPNAGIPATVSADVDIKLRAGQLGANVRSPGILIYHELQVFEGVCEHRMPKAFVDLLEQWRRVCTTPMPMRPQTFLDLRCLDRPMSCYVSTAKRLLLEKLGPPTPAV
ncbi:hypothetical protein [Mycobacterium noviomagense]|uniref:Uncharacterized protein n=1 Tax=Mycobacterium noviomagense TaxID=459858 RepID=A0A7I7PEY3_9MYCO|nr:hypothetical protein [Mycobacterium noviomagense]ORB12682.1 hypothetical protein BST37_15675 [Mycobacterium noviomagense]BBY07102.1 hypothetical protein MNVI_24200 [Mycobacterium noviomagense]